jgi:hypothetical protein
VNELELREIAIHYVRYAEELSSAGDDDDAMWEPERDPDQAAYDLVDHVIRKGPAMDAWALVREVLAQAPNERLDAYAVGPLEDLVRIRGTEVVDVIEAEAKADERFRWALGCIWAEAKALPHEVLVRIVNASEGKIRPLGWASPGESSQAAT